MKRSAPYPTFRSWLNDESYGRQPVDLSNTIVNLSQTVGVLPVAHGGTGSTESLGDGQLLVGVGGGGSVAANVTAGDGILVENAPGSITISQDPDSVVNLSQAAGVLPVANGGTGSANPLGDGQLLVGVDGGVPTPANITAGAGILVENAPGSITISQNLLAVSKVTSDTTATTSSLIDILLEGMSVTPGEGDFLVFFDGILQHTNKDARSSTITMYLNGSPVIHTERSLLLQKSEEVGHIGTMAYVSGVTGGQTIDIRWRTGASDTVAAFYGRALIAIKLAG